MATGPFGGYTTSMSVAWARGSVVASLALAAACVWSSPTQAESRAWRCGTQAARALPSSATATTGILSRPDSTQSLRHPSLPIVVHHSGDDVSAAAVLAELTAAAAQQHDVAGFPLPLADDVGFDDDGGGPELDVYLAPLPAGVGALTVSGADVDDAADHDRRPVFVAIDPRQGADVVAAAVHHEYNHALQFAVDATESVMFFEASAVAFEVRGAPRRDVVA